MSDDIIIDRVEIIGTSRVVWKAWKRCDPPADKWPFGYGYRTITHFDGVAYGRMGTERFDCPAVPDGVEKSGRWRQWRWDRFIDHKVVVTRAAHDAILIGMPPGIEPREFDDNGTIYTD
jgi:hypothetical protein